jgi:hypothetical protein
LSRECVFGEPLPSKWSSASVPWYSGFQAVITEPLPNKWSYLSKYLQTNSCLGSRPSSLPVSFISVQFLSTNHSYNTAGNLTVLYNAQKSSSLILLVINLKLFVLLIITISPSPHNILSSNITFKCRLPFPF